MIILVQPVGIRDVNLLLLVPQNDRSLVGDTGVDDLCAVRTPGWLDVAKRRGGHALEHVPVDVHHEDVRFRQTLVGRQTGTLRGERDLGAVGREYRLAVEAGGIFEAAQIRPIHFHDVHFEIVRIIGIDAAEYPALIRTAGCKKYLFAVWRNGRMIVWEREDVGLPAEIERLKGGKLAHTAAVRPHYIN